MTALKMSILAAAGSCFQWQSTKQQTDTARELLVSIVEHLGAKETSFSLTSWRRTKLEPKESEYVRPASSSGKA